MRAAGPLVVGLGGTLRAGSSTERALRFCLDEVEKQGGRTKFYAGPDIDLPMYAPHESGPHPEGRRTRRRAAGRRRGDRRLARLSRRGVRSGQERTRLHRGPAGGSAGVPGQHAVGLHHCAYGWQAAVGTLGQLRVIGHALRAWPTPLGVPINSADPVWDSSGELIDTTVRGQLEMLASQVLSFALDRRSVRS